MIKQIGDITNTLSTAENIINNIRKNLYSLNIQKKLKKAIYLIWRNPYMTINGNTFISHMMKIAGFENVFAHKKDNYPVITGNEIKNSGAEIILLSDEPYHFKEKHFSEFKKVLPGADILMVDGEMFTWFGSRMQKAMEYFKNTFLLFSAF